MDATLADLGRDLGGRLCFDATNNMGGGGGPVPMHSLASFAAAAPEASVYRAFNTLGWENFAEPVVGGQQADLFFCGPDGDSRLVAEGMISDVGLHPVWVGGNEMVDVVDSIASLWFALALRRGLGRRLAFKLLVE
jgi:predicted dinucleotide-binding enzyme